MREAQEVERLRFAKATPCAFGRREATKLDQARLIRVQRQRERRQPLCQLRSEPFGVGLNGELGSKSI